MGDASENDLEKNAGDGKKRPSLVGLAILIVIIVVCVVIAVFLAIGVPSRQMTPDDIARNPSDQALPVDPATGEPLQRQTAGEGDGVNAIEVEEIPELSPEEIAAINAQIRILGTISDAISSFQLEQDRYPDDIEELVAVTDFVLPDNPLTPEAPVRHIAPGEFSPGDFSYLPYFGRRGGPVQGFILVAYATQTELGTTIEDPLALIPMYIFDPPIESPLPGIVLAMGEGRRLIDLSDFDDTN